MSLVPLFGWPLTLVAALALIGLVVWSRRWLMRAEADPGSRTTWWRRLTLALVVVAMLMGPSIPFTSTVGVSSVEVYLVVDRTGSMGAEDWAGGPEAGGGTRMDGMRADLMSIVEAYPDARFSIIALDSAAALELPLSEDIEAATSWINSVHQEVTGRSAGSSLERALPMLNQTLKSNAEKSPQGARIVYILSDGEATDDGEGAREAAAAGVSWSDLSEYVDGGFVLGYGAPEGGRMKTFDAAGNLGPDYIQDPSTNSDAVSVPDTEELEGVAADVGLGYLQRTGGSNDARPGAFTTIDVDSTRTEGRRGERALRYLTWPLGVVAAALVAWELAALVRAERVARLMIRSVWTSTSGGAR